MKINTKHYLGLSLLIFSTSLFASGTFNGNWTEKFETNDGHYVLHTPNSVSFDGFITGGTGIHLDTKLNGTLIKNLNLETNSTREEFVASLCRSNLSFKVCSRS